MDLDIECEQLDPVVAPAEGHGPMIHGFRWHRFRRTRATSLLILLRANRSSRDGIIRVSPGRPPWHPSSSLASEQFGRKRAHSQPYVDRVHPFVEHHHGEDDRGGCRLDDAEKPSQYRSSKRQKGVLRKEERPSRFYDVAL